MCHNTPLNSADRGRQFSGSEAGLVYMMSFRTARATEKPCLETKKEKGKSGEMGARQHA